MKKNKKIKLGVFIGVGCVVLIALIFIIIALVSNNTKLSTPTNLGIVSTTTGKTYVYVDKCESAKKYKFEIVNTKTQSGHTYTSSVNQFDATSIFNTPATYTISCKYIGNNQKQDSDACAKITYKSTKQIATPSISLGIGADKNKLFVETSNNFGEKVLFDFTLHYTDGQTIFPNSHSTPPLFFEKFIDSNGTVQGYFLLNTIFKDAEKGLQYNLAVTVSQKVNAGEETYYLTSNLSSQVTYTIE